MLLIETKTSSVSNSGERICVSTSVLASLRGSLEGTKSILYSLSLKNVNSRAG